MRPWRASTPVKFPVGLKFAGAVGAVAVGVLTVAVTAGIGLGQLQSDVERLISDDLASVRVVDDLAISVYPSEEAVLAEQAAAGPDRTPVTTLLDQLLLPRLTEQLRTAREWFAGNASATEHLNRVSRSLDDFVAQRSPEAAPGPPAGVAVPFDRMTTEVRAVRDDEYTATQRSAEEARDTYVATRQELVIATLASLLAALTVVLLLVRDLVPRLRAYAAFAADVAAGRQVRRLDPRGADELAHLGRALDDMVARTDATRRQEADQAEFVDTLQVTASEDEAHELVRRHLQRSLPGRTSTTSSRSTTASATPRATRCWPRWARRCGRACGRATSPGASAAKSCSCCCPRRPPRKRWRSPSGSAT